MKFLTKYEAIGIFASIAIMAVVLGAMRFSTNIFASNVPEGETQGAALVAVKDTTSKARLEGELLDAHALDGTLVNLVTEDIRLGTGDEAVENGDTVVVHYEGRTQDGVQFDSSYERGEPYTFTVGEGTVIEGWEEGLIGMKEGGKRILVIPSEMAYGNRQVGMIPPNSVLVFAVELVELR